jgi:hypothetical protein
MGPVIAKMIVDVALICLRCCVSQKAVIFKQL